MDGGEGPKGNLKVLSVYILGRQLLHIITDCQIIRKLSIEVPHPIIHDA